MKAILFLLLFACATVDAAPTLTADVAVSTPTQLLFGHGCVIQRFRIDATGQNMNEVYTSALCASWNSTLPFPNPMPHTLPIGRTKIPSLGIDDYGGCSYIDHSFTSGGWYIEIQCNWGTFKNGFESSH